MGSYVPSTQAQREQMLRAVGLENIMDLYRDVPEQMLPLGLGGGDIAAHAQPSSAQNAS